MPVLKMNYDDMEAEIKKLTGIVSEFKTTAGSMDLAVVRLCEGWESESTAAYSNDYKALRTNIEKTVDVVEQLIASTQKYVDSMKLVDKSFADTKVTVG